MGSIPDRLLPDHANHRLVINFLLFQAGIVYCTTASEVVDANTSIESESLSFPVRKDTVIKTSDVKSKAATMVHHQNSILARRNRNVQYPESSATYARVATIPCRIAVSTAS